MYPNHYINNLKTGLNNPARFILTLIIISLAIYVGSIPLRIQSLDDYFQANPLIYFTVLLVPFIFGLSALIYCFWFIHGLSYKKLLIPIGTDKLDLKRLVFSFGLWTVILIVMEIVSYFFDKGNYKYHVPDLQFIRLFILAFLLLPIQTSFEELLIRSYLTQQINFFAKNIILAIFSSSLVFAFMHINNPETGAFGYGVMLIYYFIAGLFLSILAYKDNRLELSLGVHAANNVFGAIIVNYQVSVFKTTALFTTEKINILLSLVSFCIASVVFYLICYYKFNWKWKETGIE